MVYNFSAGPATIYKEVLKHVQKELLDYKGIGYSLLEASHRGKQYDRVHNNAVALLKQHMSLGDDYSVIFQGGGATLQFAMLAYNFLTDGIKGQYVHTGAWAEAAIISANKVCSTTNGSVEIIYDGKDRGYTTLPDPSQLEVDSNSRFVHITSNETIGGLQWKELPEVGSVALAADMSSDIFSRRLDFNKFDFIYAGAQKNLGTAGATVVIIKNSFLEKANENLPPSLSYKMQVSKNSLLNTPPIFAVWMLEQVFSHMNTIGGLEKIEKYNHEKAALLYDHIDSSNGFYSCPVDVRYRSTMNVVFRLPHSELDATFVDEANMSNLIGLKGHRSVGGCRASIYNAMSIEGVEYLIDFMRKFKRKY